MEKNLIMFNNMTNLMKAKELLRKNGIVSRTVRTPSRLKNGSCGFSLQVNNNFERAFELINEKGIRIVGASEVDLS